MAGRQPGLVVAGTVVAILAPVVIAAAGAVLLDLLREQPAAGPLRVDLDPQAAVEPAEAAPDPLELGRAVDVEPDAVAALGPDPKRLRGGVLADHCAVEVPQRRPRLARSEGGEQRHRN